MSDSLLFKMETPASASHSPHNHHSEQSRRIHNSTSSRSPLSISTPLSTPGKSPQRCSTDPTSERSSLDLPLHKSVMKRIIICCDGTWQDGIATEQKASYTNVLRLSRTINYEDDRHSERGPPIPQIVFYQSGIGTERNLYSEYVDGATGGSLADKVEEAYAFVAHNYRPGDEIFLFGFSRGAYTARMVAMFIGEIGVLDRTDMDHFASIFIAYKKLGNMKDQSTPEAEELKQILAPWKDHGSRGKQRADSDKDTFSIKCIGLFDTVGSLGLPEELTLNSKKIRTLFGFPDNMLGEHIERAYQALALHETRADFNCNKLHQAEAGMKKEQVLKQCWFSGSHTDIGGGYTDHDLADITLAWMAANIGDMLSLDITYLARLPQPVALWGTQKPHDSATGIFSFAHTIKRPLPGEKNNTTHETIHSSVQEQASLYPELSKLLTDHPDLVCPLLPLEEELKLNWPYEPQSPVVRSYTDRLINQKKDETSQTWAQTLIRTGSRRLRNSIIFRRSTLKDTTVKTEAGKPVNESLVGRGTKAPVV